MTYPMPAGGEDLAIRRVRRDRTCRHARRNQLSVFHRAARRDARAQVQVAEEAMQIVRVNAEQPRLIRVAVARALEGAQDYVALRLLHSVVDTEAMPARPGARPRTPADPRRRSIPVKTANAAFPLVNCVFEKRESISKFHASIKRQQRSIGYSLSLLRSLFSRTIRRLSSAKIETCEFFRKWRARQDSNLRPRA